MLTLVRSNVEAHNPQASLQAKPSGAQTVAKSTRKSVPTPSASVNGICGPSVKTSVFPDPVWKPSMLVVVVVVVEVEVEVEVEVVVLGPRVGTW